MPRPRALGAGVAGALALAGCAVMLGPTQRRPEGAARGEPLYYSDLGPDAVDVSSYPAIQQENYKVYSRACSQCHSLARSVNAPMVSRRYWEFYVLGMRFNTHFRQGAKLSKQEVDSILDFLEYDSNLRKVVHKEEFQALTARLEDQFQPILDARLQRLLQSVPDRLRQGDLSAPPR